MEEAAVAVTEKPRQGAPPAASTGSSLLRSGLIFWLGRMGCRLVSVLLLPLYTAFIAPAEWGALSLLLISGDLLVLVLSAQLSQAVYREWALTSDEGRRRRLTGIFLAAPMLFSTIAFAPFYIFADRLDGIIGIEGFGNPVRLYLLTLQLSLVMATVMSELRLRNEVTLYAGLDIGQNVSQAAINILLVVAFGMGIKGIILGQFLAFFLATAIFLPRVLRRCRPNLDASLLKGLLAFSLPLIPSAAAMALVHNVGRYFLQAWCGPEDVGVFSVGFRFGTVVNVLVLGPFLLLWEPKSYEIARRADAGEKLGRVFTLFAALVLFVAAGLTGASREIVEVMTDPKYWGASAVIPIIAFSYVLFGLDSIGRVGLLMNHRTKTVLAVVLATCVLGVAGNALLVPSQGMVGSAWVSLGGFLFLFLADLFLSQKLIPIRFEWRKLAVLAAITAGTILAMVEVRFDRMWLTVATKLAILSAFPVLLAGLGFFGRPSRRWLRGDFRSA